MPLGPREVTVTLRRDCLARGDEALRWLIHWGRNRIVLAVFRYAIKIENTGTERVTGELVVPFSEPPERRHGYITILETSEEVLECRQTGAKEGGPTLTLTPKVPEGQLMARPSLATGQLDLHPGESVDVEVLTVWPAPHGHPLVAPVPIPTGEGAPLPTVRLRGVAIVERNEAAAISPRENRATESAALTHKAPARLLKSWSITVAIGGLGFLLGRLPLASLLARPESRTTALFLANMVAMLALAVGGSVLGSVLLEYGLRGAWGRAWVRWALLGTVLGAGFLAWQSFRAEDWRSPAGQHAGPAALYLAWTRPLRRGPDPGGEAVGP